MDLVVNHCSDQHEWFQRALKDSEGEYADYFFFRKEKNGTTPNNMRSYFGGSVWEPVPGADNNQWFYQMECLDCGHKYFVNGSDIWQRKCPKCQGGQA